MRKSLNSQKKGEFSKVWRSLCRGSLSWLKESCLEQNTLNAWKVITLATSYEALSQPGPAFLNFPCMSKPSSIVSTGSLCTVAIGHNCNCSTEKPYCSSKHRQKKENQCVCQSAHGERRHLLHYPRMRHSLTISSVLTCMWGVLPPRTPVWKQLVGHSSAL